MAKDEIKTVGYVLRRTNYGEADRILNIITPEGKIAVLARGVRKSKSKLAGGIEMFTLSELNIHRGRGELGILTSAKMKKYYGGILADYRKLEMISAIFKKVSMAAESSDSPEYFKIVDCCLEGLGSGMDLQVVDAWFALKIMKIMGEEPNLYRDADGEKLQAELRYDWSNVEQAFAEREQGMYEAGDIKILRLMVGAELKTIVKIKDLHARMPKVLAFVHGLRS